MTYILITDVQYRKEFDNISIIKKLFPKEHLILGTTKGKLFCHLAYGHCSVEKLRTEEGKDVVCLDRYFQGPRDKMPRCGRVKAQRAREKKRA